MTDKPDIKPSSLEAEIDRLMIGKAVDRLTERVAAGGGFQLGQRTEGSLEALPGEAEEDPRDPNWQERQDE
jgi:hypothetical protein